MRDRNTSREERKKKEKSIKYEWLAESKTSIT
jgi:hypothetical protein